MSYCLNPYCRTPQNPSGMTVCQTCGTALLLKERYRPVEELGGGGMSRTFLAVDLDRLNTPCIIKQFSPQSHKVSLVKEAIERFNQEALRLQELGIHAQIPALYAYFEQEQHLYLIEEWVEGKNLLEELQETGAFSENKIIQLLEDILLILQFIHQHHIIHRDIKPDNIIRRKNDQKLVLVDFGIAKYSLNLVQPQTGTLAGTIGYAPLEQMRGGKSYPASDLYSLGMTCIHLLTQISPNQLFDPFTGELIWRSHLKNMNKTLSQRLTQILDKLLQDLVKERYQTVEEVLRDLAPQTLTPLSSPIPMSSHSPLSIIVATELQAVTPNLFSQNRLFFKPDPARQLTHNYLFLEQKNCTLTTALIPLLARSKCIYKPQYKPQLPHISLDCISTLFGHKDKIKALAISPNGHILVSGSQDKTLIIWNLKTGQLLHRLIGHEAGISSVAISPNGRKLVSGSLDRTLIAWNLDKRAIADRFFSHSGSPYSHRCGAVYAVAYSPDGCMIASGSEDQSIKIWNQRNGELLYRYSEHLDAVLSVKFINHEVQNQGLSALQNSYHHHLFVSASQDSTIKIWQLGRLQSLQTLTGHLDQVTSIIVSPNQPLLVSGSADNTVKLWNFNTGELVKTLTNHSAQISSVAMSPDGRWLASSSDDGIIHLWDMSQPQNLGILSCCLKGYPPIIFSPDHQRFICCGQDEQILVWKLSDPP